MDSIGVEVVNAEELYLNTDVVFSICILVTNPDQFKEALSSFKKNGFVNPFCEYLYLDNVKENKYDAFEALNIFLSVSRGKYIIICHQDIELLDDGYSDLLNRISEVEKIDENWGVLGNAGGINLSNLAIRISDPHGSDISRNGPFPVKVKSLDENLLIVKAAANLSVSKDMRGFHLYGTDLCVMADIQGYSSYVIDFHLQHKSAGNILDSDDDLVNFYYVKQLLLDKYARAFSPRWIRTTCSKFFISGSSKLNKLGNSSLFLKLAKRLGR